MRTNSNRRNRANAALPAAIPIPPPAAIETFEVLEEKPEEQFCHYRVKLDGEEKWLYELEMTRPQRMKLEAFRAEVHKDEYVSRRAIKEILDIRITAQGEMILVNFRNHTGPAWNHWVNRNEILKHCRKLKRAFFKKILEKARLNDDVMDSTDLSIASTSDQNFVFKYGGTEVKFHEAKADYGEEAPSDEHIQIMKTMIEKNLVQLRKFVKDEEKKGVRLPEKNERGQRAIYYGETNYKKITENVEEEDNEKVRIEILGPTVDYDALADILQLYYAVIEGYHEDKTPLSDAQFFHLMKMCLETFNTSNDDPQKPTISPDALYYALYTMFPLTGSQQRMSIIFPKLVSEYGTEEDLELESWKKERDEKTRRHYFSVGNCFGVCLPYKQGECLANCYKGLRLAQKIKKQIPEFNDESFMIYLPKNLKVEQQYVGFLDALFGSAQSATEPVDFCKIAGKYLEQTNQSCKDLYQYVLNLDSIRFKKPPQVDQLAKSYQERRSEFDEVREDCNRRLSEQINAELSKMVKEEEKTLRRRLTKKEKTALSEENYGTLESQAPLCKPCSHFGPCGPEQENCSCKNWCTEQCGCDANCARRFPGCQCPPGGCHEGETDVTGTGMPVGCICVAEWRECVPGLCHGCLDHEDEPDTPANQKCQNFMFQRGTVDCSIEARASEIAGTGAFLTRDVVKGECVAEYVGAHISVAEAARRDRLFFYGISYVHELPSSLGCIDSAFVGNESRFLNHDHESPNIRISCKFVDGKPRLRVDALRDMPAGTELLLNYGYNEEGARDMFTIKPEQRAPQLPIASSSDNNNPGPSSQKGRSNNSDDESTEGEGSAAKRRRDDPATKNQSCSYLLRMRRS